jgi:HlyD family secretion protein
VKEGAVIQRGEVLATFDHRQGLLAELEEINAKLRSLQQQIALQTVEVSRFQKAAEWGSC